jgi:hypothetical protein
MPVTGRGGLQGCLDNRLTDGGKFASLKRWPLLFSPEILCSASGHHFRWRLIKPQGLLGPEVLGKLIKIIHLVGSRTRYLPTCSTAP